jgi:hypothetical protein
MASFIVDLTLCEILEDGTATFNETFPGTPERERTVRKIFEEAGVRPGSVSFRVLEERGPAGGNPECEFRGERDEIAKVVRWAVEGMNEDESWADEYWVDRT